VIASALSALLALHLSAAAAATMTFWTAASLEKGGTWHRRMGRWFGRGVYVTAVSGAIMAVTGLVDPAGMRRAEGASVTPEAMAIERQTLYFVLYVLLVIVAPVQHGLAVVAAGATPVLVRSRAHATLALASMIGSVALIPAALLWQRWHFLIVAPIGLVVGLRALAWASRPRATPREWEREHLTSMLTAGITLHTALLVFGTTRTLGWSTSGLPSVWPWVIPALVGLPVILWLRARWRRGR